KALCLWARLPLLRLPFVRVQASYSPPQAALPTSGSGMAHPSAALPSLLIQPHSRALTVSRLAMAPAVRRLPMWPSLHRPVLLRARLRLQHRQYVLAVLLLLLSVAALPTN